LTDFLIDCYDFLKIILSGKIKTMTIENKKVVIGGTFEALHKGHQVFLEKAFNLGDDVFIGLTSDTMAKRAKGRTVKVFNERKQKLEDFINENFKAESKIQEIDDEFGPTLQEDFDYILVSPETHKTALLINEERKKINKKPIEIIEIEFVLAEDQKPISSTRVLEGIIDTEGNIL